MSFFFKSSFIFESFFFVLVFYKKKINELNTTEFFLMELSFLNANHLKTPKKKKKVELFFNKKKEMICKKKKGVFVF